MGGESSSGSGNENFFSAASCGVAISLMRSNRPLTWQIVWVAAGLVAIPAILDEMELDLALEQHLEDGDAFSPGDALATPFPASGLGQQLRAVAQTIAIRDTLGAKRQVFFVGMGGFDTHSAQANDLPGLQQSLSDAITAYLNAQIRAGAQAIQLFDSWASALDADEFIRGLRAGIDVNQCLQKSYSYDERCS